MRSLFIAFSFVSFLSAIPVRAQTAADVNEGSRLTKDVETGSCSFAWWGKGARTYFIQHSDDLVTWTYLPLIESGAAAVTEYGFTSTAQKSFFRLRFSDAATGGNPETADFDGDHVGNMTELNQMTDPLGWTDVDGDQVPDDWEVIQGFNPSNAADAVLDTDGDGLTNRAEFNHASDPHLKDTDGDGFEDGYEVSRGTDPALVSSSPLISVQGQVAQVAALAQSYVSVRATGGSLEAREAAWSALVAAKQALDAELADLLPNAETPGARDGVEDAQEGADGGVAPAYGLPSTAILQYRWGNAAYGGKHRLARWYLWQWNGVAWEFAGLDHEFEDDIDNSGGWHDSDYHGAGTSSLAETMNVTFAPQEWRSVDTESLTAAGTYEVGPGTNTGVPPPTGSGPYPGATVLSSEVTTSPEVYTAQWREYRLKRSEDGDQGVPLFMNFVSSDATHEAFGEVLAMAGGAQESSATITAEARPTEPNVGVTASKRIIEIRPDAGMYADGVGFYGDEVPSARSNSRQKHFVTPKASADLSASYVIFHAAGATAEDFDTTPPMIPNLSWAGGEAVPGDSTRRRVSRHTTGQTQLRLTSKDGGTDVVMNVWVVWAELASGSPQKLRDPITGTSGGGYTGPNYASATFTFDIKPIELFEGFNSGRDVPKLDGQNRTLGPDLTGSVATTVEEDTAVRRWDVTRRLKIKLKDKGSVPSLVGSDWIFGRGAQLALSEHSGSFPAASIEIMQFPADKWRGNDDPKSVTGEDNNPYSAADTYLPAIEGSDPMPSIGQVASYDSPTTPSIYATSGTLNQEAEGWLQFEEFVRLELGEAHEQAKWFVISDSAKWESIKRFKRTKPYFFSSEEMRENGSAMNFSHSNGY